MSKHPMMCDLCGEGTLEEKQGVNTVTYKSVSKDLRNDFCECDVCGVEVTLPQQTRDNKRRMVAFKKEVNGLLTGSEVLAIRKQLGLKQSEAAQIFGGGSVAFAKYEADDVTQSEGMDKLLRIAAEFPPVFSYLKRKAGVSTNVQVFHQPLWSSIGREAANESDGASILAEAAEPKRAYEVKEEHINYWGECQ
ncbi:type II toxin-antitoxin system MqsA family antitoxin [Idiomarina sp. ST20R2A10]|uniref:type II toxin-antitoxin system MqsA family antitoxin n=1 Tax=Idiomarina sp. ST20R2A10 TaxID=3418369 RepID=UPI003EC4B37A